MFQAHSHLQLFGRRVTRACTSGILVRSCDSHVRVKWSNYTLLLSLLLLQPKGREGGRWAGGRRGGRKMGGRGES